MDFHSSLSLVTMLSACNPTFFTASSVILYSTNKKGLGFSNPFLLAEDETRLGFAPRSNSLVYEPTVLTNSIFSLSGLALCASSVRKSAELAKVLFSPVST